MLPCVQVQADAQQWAEVPLTTSVVPRPWPKSRREVAPNAFRITVPEGSLAELGLPIADPQQALKNDTFYWKLDEFPMKSPIKSNKIAVF